MRERKPGLLEKNLSIWSAWPARSTARSSFRRGLADYRRRGLDGRSTVSCGVTRNRQMTPVSFGV
jgi:hypothetical protein